MAKKVTNNNVLQDEHIDRIMALFASKANADHVSASIENETIAANDYNLSVSSYVEARNNRETFAIADLNGEIAGTVEKINALRTSIDAIIKEIEA